MPSLLFSILTFLAFIAICTTFTDASPLASVATATSPSETVAQLQPDDSDGSPTVADGQRQDDGGSFDVILVSGFYGPGAFVSWIFIAISTILDKLFEPSSSELVDEHRDSHNEDHPSSTTVSASEHAKKFVYGQILGFDLNLLSTLAYPCIAAANASLYFRKLQQDGGMEPDDVARFAAPLAALRTWNTTLGALLVAAWAARITQRNPKTSGKTYISIGSKGFRVRRDIIAVLLWILSLSAMRLFFLVVRHYTHLSEAEWQFVELLARASPEGSINFEPILYAFVMIGTVAYFIYFVLEDGPPPKKETRTFLLVFAVYVLCYILGASFDIILCSRFWYLEVPEKPNPLLLDAQATSLYSTMNFRLVNQEEGLAYFHDYFARLQGMKRDFQLSYDLYPRVWGIVEDLLLWPASVLHLDVWPIIKIAATIQKVINWIFLSVLGILVLVAVLAFIVPKIPYLSSFVSEDLCDELANASPALIFSVISGSMVGDVALMWFLSTTWLQILFPLFRPDLLIPASASGWTDLDQMTALILNGLVPLVFSLKAGFQSHNIFSRMNSYLKRILSR